MSNFSFDRYRPHDRVQWDGSITDPHTGEVSFPPSMTKQGHKDECDINRIVKQFSVTGQWAHINGKAALGAYVDLPDGLDYQSSLDIVRQGEVAFASLPSKVRDRFRNDPAQFLQFLSDPANRSEAVELGLVNAPPDFPPTAPLDGGAAPSKE